MAASQRADGEARGLPESPLRRGSATSPDQAQQPPPLVVLLFRGVRPALYPTAGITSTGVGGATRVTEVREGGPSHRRAEGWGEKKGKQKRGRAWELAWLPPLLPLVDIIYLASIQVYYLRHRLSTLARLIVGYKTGFPARMRLLPSLPLATPPPRPPQGSWVRSGRGLEGELGDVGLCVGSPA